MEFTAKDVYHGYLLKDTLSNELAGCGTVQDAGRYLFMADEEVERGGRVLAALGMTAPAPGLTQQEQAACRLLDALGEEVFFGLVSGAFNPTARKAILLGLAGLIVKGIIPADTEPCRGS